jgi:DNA-binding NarL/FixJ family response regulator
MEKINEDKKNDKIKVLILDDDENFLLGFKYATSKIEDMEIIAIKNPIEALEYLKNNENNIIFVDYFMPEMTGQEFVLSLRKMSNNSLVILQTGYSDKNPPIEMIKDMNIQGYFDKTKDPEELELLVRSTIKTYKLMQIVQKQEKQIDKLSHKNEFMGSLIVGITDGLKTQIATIETGLLMINKKLDKKQLEEFDKILKSVNSSILKAKNVLKSLNFDTILTNNLYDIIEIVKTLTKIKTFFEDSKIEYKMKGNYLIDCKSNILILALVEVIITYLDNGIKNISIDITKDSTDMIIKININIIKIESQIEYNTDELFKILEQIVLEEKNIKVIKNDNDIMFEVGLV